MKVFVCVCVCVCVYECMCVCVCKCLHVRERESERGEGKFKQNTEEFCSKSKQKPQIPSRMLNPNQCFKIKSYSKKDPNSIMQTKISLNISLLKKTKTQKTLSHAMKKGYEVAQ